MSNAEQQAALAEHAANWEKLQIDRYRKVVALLVDAEEHGDPIILTRALRGAVGV